jgi:hypothetical protein
MGTALVASDEEAEFGTLRGEVRFFVQCKVESNNGSEARLYV